VDEQRDLEGVRDQACMSVVFLYQMLQKVYSFIMSVVRDKGPSRRRSSSNKNATQQSPFFQQRLPYYEAGCGYRELVVALSGLAATPCR
jgi:hypothetical protein